MADYLEEELEMLTAQEREELGSETQETDEDKTEDVVDPAPDTGKLDAASDEAQASDEQDGEEQGLEPLLPKDEGQEEQEPKESNPSQTGVQTAPAFPTFDAPEEATIKLAQLDEKLNNLGAEFENGGMTATEYQKQMLQLMNEKIDLSQAIFKASLSQEVQEKTWFDVTVPAFLDAHPQYRENEVLFDSLNMAVRRLQSENPDKSFDPNILLQAHGKLASVFNFATADKKSVAEPKETAKEINQPQREMPPNLGALPAADMTETADGGLFSHLDRLGDENIEKYEEELAKLSDDQREAYLKFG